MTLVDLARSLAGMPLPDGRVQCIAEGAPAELDAFLAALTEALSAYIRHTTTQTAPASGRSTGANRARNAPPTSGVARGDK